MDAEYCLSLTTCRKESEDSGGLGRESCGTGAELLGMAQLTGWPLGLVNDASVYLGASQTGILCYFTGAVRRPN